MTIEENVPLRSLTTLRAGGVTAFVAHARSPQEVIAAVRFARERSLPWYVLGEGSNLLAPDAGYPGVIIRMELPGTTYTDAGAEVLVTAGAGVVWDDLVKEAAARHLWGVENLAGIPGFVGAAPVQNIGAYGTEVKDTFVSAEVLDARSETILTIDLAGAAFGYRASRFKQDPELIIMSVTFALKKAGSPVLEYGDLQRVLEEGAILDTPASVGSAVRSIRAKKFPDRRIYGTAGSFFKNPVVSEEAYKTLKEMYPALPGFLAPSGIKIPLAYILDKVLALRGFRMGRAWLYDAQPLVLVLDADGTAEDVDALASHVAHLVKEKTNIVLEREVRTLE